MCVLILALLTADGGVPDRPVVTKTAHGYLFSDPAYNAVDAEMKRLQEVERRAKVEKERKQPWVEVILISAAVGLAAGATVGVVVGRLLPK